MSMSELICVTNRTLCREDFFARMEQIAAARPGGILLREKDVSEAAYENLAKEALAICQAYGVPCILHSFADVAARQGCRRLHLPLPILRRLPDAEKSRFPTLGASCHSVEDAREAEALGCTYITAGHIFETDCKKGLPGRGLAFLKRVCESVSLPVYAIGGVRAKHMAAIKQAKAAGACVMGGAMQCEDVNRYLSEFKEKFHDL